MRNEEFPPTTLTIVPDGRAAFLIPNSQFLIRGRGPRYQVGEEAMSSSAAGTVSGRENQ